MTADAFLDQTLPHGQPGFDSLAQRLGRLLPRSEVRGQARGYLRALLSPIERKNGWQMAQCLGHQTPYKLQHLLGRIRWDADALRDELQRYVVEHLGEQDGVLIVDETGFVKKGSHSAGVARQYSGTAGRVENCQVGVFLAYAASRGQALIDRALYLPQEWAQDKQRCRKAGIAEGVAFTTKPKIARQMLERAFAAGVPARWVTDDAVYGSDRSLQLWLQGRGQAHVLAVSGQERLYTGGQGHRVKDLLPTIGEDGWQRHNCGAGSKGERQFAWAWREVNQGPGLEGVAAGAPQPLGPAADERVPRVRCGRYAFAGAGSGGGPPLGDRVLLGAGQGRGGPGPVRGALLGGLVSARDALDGGCGVAVGGARRRGKGTVIVVKGSAELFSDQTAFRT